MRIFEPRVASLLSRAGVSLNDPDARLSVRINNPRVFRRFLLGGTIGLGESFVDGDWDCDDLSELFRCVIAAGADRGRGGIPGALTALAWVFRNAQSINRAHHVARDHYDLGNDLYRAMLDPRMVYTCAYYGRGAETLEQAQEDKLRLVCEKIGLRSGQRVLDIGCGWGSFAKFAAEEYGAHVVGIANSDEQLSLARELCKGLPVDFLNLDYRYAPDTLGHASFDHVVSIGMFEAVGPKNFRTYMRVAKAVLKPDGLFLLHTIGMQDGGFDPWIERHIFPNGYLPSLEQIGRAVRDVFVIEDVHNFGTDYDRTLCAWYENFEAAWSELAATGAYDERFRRKWAYYLLQCAGAFRARSTHLWQIVLSPYGVPGGYQSIR